MKKLIFAALLLSTTAQADLYCNNSYSTYLCVHRYGHYPAVMYESREHMINHLTAIGYPLPVKTDGTVVNLPGLNYTEDMFGSLHNR